jgi:RNA polymerase sigma factor (sigma-70 family)
VSLNKQLTEGDARLLFEEHRDYVLKIAYLLSKSQTMADDILQETFVQVFRKYDTYDSSKPFEPWLYRLTVNIAKNILRKQRWLFFTAETKEQVDQNEPTPTERLLQDEMTQAMKSEIQKLSFNSREIIILHFYTGLTLNEISETLGIPVGTCKSRLNTALNKLRKQLKGNDFFKFETGGELL